jgi:hypothetical protein
MLRPTGESEIRTDTVGEFPEAADRPESGQVGDPGESESRSPDGPDEFANSISNGEKTNNLQRAVAG